MESNNNQIGYTYKYSNRYHGIKSHLHIFIYDNFCKKKMYDDFNPERILSHSHMIYDYLDNYLYDCENINDVIFNYRKILINIMSCMFTLDLRMRVINGLFDTIVDYIIENDCYSKFDDINDLITIFTYISPEKLYDYICYMYKSSSEQNKKFINDNICEKIYLTNLYNSNIVTIVNYGYEDIENIGKVVYKYYILIKKLQNDNIIIKNYEKIENTKYELVKCNRSDEYVFPLVEPGKTIITLLPKGAMGDDVSLTHLSAPLGANKDDIIYVNLLTNIMNDMLIHRNINKNDK